MNNRNIENLSPFILFCQKVIPLAFDESLSYYECLCALVKHIQLTDDAVNNNADAVTNLNNYVNNYFENLDVQNEINNKLDIMAQSGELADIVGDYIELKGVLAYNTINDMKNATNITNGSFAKTYGKLSYLDGDGRFYKIRSLLNTDVVDEVNIISLTNFGGLIAELIPESYLNSINNLSTNFNTLSTDVNESLNNFNEKLNSATSGSPAGVYATVSDLTNADPDHSKIYVVSADGKWYYYNTTTSLWTAGGTYQSTSIGTGTIDIENLNETLKNITKIYIPTIDNTEVGKYIANNGTISTSVNFTLLTTKLPANSTLFFKAKGYLTNVAMISIKSNNYLLKTAPVVISLDSNEHLYKYVNNSNKEIVICLSYLTSGGYTLYIAKDNVINYENQVIYDNAFINSNATDNTYITPTGNIYTSNNFKLSDYLPITNNLAPIIVSNNSINPSSEPVAVAYFDKSRTFISGEQLPKTNYLNLTVPLNTKYIRFSLPKNEELEVVVNRNSLINVINNLINENNIKNDNIKRSIGITDKAIFIGDSLTVGQTYISDTSPVSYNNYYNYPYFLKKLMQIDNIEELSFGGAKTDTWWNKYNENIIDTNSLYFVWLGTNDTFTDTVATDCIGDDYTQFANTETGYFGKILGKIKSLSGNKIVLINNFVTSGTLSINNKVINELANKYDCVVIDIASSDCKNVKYHTAYNGHINGVHFNEKGNNYVANYINNELNNYLENNQFEMYKVQS